MSQDDHALAALLLDDVRRSAKALLRALNDGDSSALSRLSATHPRFYGKPAAGPFRLHHAQLVLARESGFPSWPKLKAWFDVRDGGVEPLRIFRTEPDYFKDRAAGLKSMALTGDRRARAEIVRHHPRFHNTGEDDAAWETLSDTDAELVLARQHGADTFEQLTTTLSALEDEVAPRDPFRSAYQAIENVDRTALEAVISCDPAIVGAAGTNGNTLLNLAAGALVTPDLTRSPSERNTEEELRLTLVKMLLDAGADPDFANQKGWTPLHQAAYSDNIGLAQLLIAAEATFDLEAYDAGGTPLTVALWWGHTEVAEYLALVGAVPDTLRVASGLGAIEHMRRFFNPEGRLTEAADRFRAFHRPHAGFPPWKPTPGHRQEILDDAFSFAVRSERLEAMAFLHARGADPDGVACNGTPLEWATIKGRRLAVRWLLDHGATVNKKADFAYNKGQTALHSAAFADRPDILTDLIAAGGDLSLRDDAYQSTPLGWALHLNKPNVAAFLVKDHSIRCDVDDLIEAGADVTVLVERLDADPDQIAGFTGTGTPLRAAAVAGRADVVRLLLERGADPGGRSRAGMTARDLAVQAGHKEVVAALEGACDK
ncbi:MAG: ankyrin repeat domain-containing protein [Pseudomonadota bacterium]